MNKIENARITKTKLGEEHGCLTADITVEGDSWGCAFGGYCLDHWCAGVGEHTSTDGYGATRSCGCIHKEKISQLDESIRIRNDEGIVTHKRCSCCGEFKELTEFYHNKTTADGYTGVCKKCSIHTLGRRYKNYKQGAKSRNLDFNLTKEEFDQITQLPCEYCGEYSGNFLGVNFCGIDRIDSGKGYVVNNVVPCCETCNRMKWDYNFDDWIYKMKKILNYMEDKNEQTSSNKRIDCIVQ